MVLLVAVLALLGRILFLGSERLFLKKLEEHDSMAIASLFFLFGAVFLAPVFFWYDFDLMTAFYAGVKFALLSSLVYSFAFYFYVKSIHSADISLVAPLYNSSLLWLLLLGYFVLHDHVTVFRALGGVVLFIGVFVLYPGGFSEKFAAVKASKGSHFMLIAAVFLAVGRTIDSFAIILGPWIPGTTRL